MAHLAPSRPTTRPIEVLVTRDLTLRPPLEVDAEPIAEALADDTIARNLSRVPHPYGVADAKAWIAGLRERPDDIVYTVHRERLVGTIAVHRRAGGPTLGYWFATHVWGRGYATQAARAVLAKAFRQFDGETIVARAFHDVPASLRVLEKLGFERTGAGTQASLSRGQDVETVEMALTRAAFEARFGLLETDRAA